LVAAKGRGFSIRKRRRERRKYLQCMIFRALKWGGDRGAVFCVGGGGGKGRFQKLLEKKKNSFSGRGSHLGGRGRGGKGATQESDSETVNEKKAVNRCLGEKKGRVGKEGLRIAQGSLFNLAAEL